MAVLLLYILRDGRFQRRFCGLGVPPHPEGV